MPIDMHTHWVPECLAEALRARSEPPFLRPAEEGETLHYTGMKSPVRPGYTSLDIRLASMERYGVDIQLLSLGNRMLNAMQSVAGDAAAPLTRVYNDGLSEACRDHPGRLLGLAMLPYDDMDAAVAEFERAMDLPGIVGATLPGNGFLDYGRAQRFRPVFEAAQRRGAHFLVHDGFLIEDFDSQPPAEIDNRALRMSTLHTQSQLSAIMVTLNLTDFLDPYPDVSVQVHNLGGNLPFEISRMDHVNLFQKRGGELPSKSFRRVYVDCNSLDGAAIELGYRLYGPGRIMFGTDGSDFGTEWSLKAVRDADIGAAAQRAILDDTAASLLERLC